VPKLFELSLAPYLADPVRLLEAVAQALYDAGDVARVGAD
jgi:hypothetical protein